MVIAIINGELLVESNSYVYKKYTYELTEMEIQELRALGFDYEVHSTCYFGKWSGYRSWYDDVKETSYQQISTLWWHLH